jgi:hypothetical protein
MLFAVPVSLNAAAMGLGVFLLEFTGNPVGET